MKQQGFPFVRSDLNKLSLNGFLGLENQKICSYLRANANKKGGAIFIYGERGWGKTHLLKGWERELQAEGIAATYFDIKKEFPESEEVASNCWLCLDNLDYLSQRLQYEFLDFCFQNEQGHINLVLSSMLLPRDLNLMNDLKTRLGKSTILRLKPPSDEEKKSALHAWAKAQNLVIETSVYDFLLRHFSRDLEALLEAVSILDRASLAEGSNITIPLAKRELQI